MKNKFISTKLNNDAKLYYVKNKLNKATYVDVMFTSGASCDTIPGLAHFVEHMFFTGTKDMPKDEIWKRYGEFISTNAFTQLRGIAFTGSIFTNELKDYLSFVEKLIDESEFTPEAVEKERKIINQEITTYADKHENIAYMFNRHNLYNLPAYKEDSLVGSIKSIKNITSKDVKQFVQKYFVANNLELIICSPLSISKIKKIANTNLASKLRYVENYEKPPIDFYDVADDKFFKTKKAKIEKTYIKLNFAFPKSGEDFEYSRILGTALDIVNDGAIGVLKQLRLKKDLVYSAYLSYATLPQNSVLTLNCECEPNNVNEVIKTFAEYLNNLLQDGFQESQLQKIKRAMKHSDVNKLPSISFLMNRLYDYRWYGKLLDHKKLKEVRQNCTLEQVNSAFKEAISNSKASLSLYGTIQPDLLSKAEFNKLFDFKNK